MSATLAGDFEREGLAPTVTQTNHVCRIFHVKLAMLLCSHAFAEQLGCLLSSSMSIWRGSRKSEDVFSKVHDAADLGFGAGLVSGLLRGATMRPCKLQML